MFECVFRVPPWLHFSTKRLCESAKCRQFTNSSVFRFSFLASQASDVGSIPIARSITHDDSIVLTPLDQLDTAIKLVVLVP